MGLDDQRVGKIASRSSKVDPLRGMQVNPHQKSPQWM